MKSDILIIGSGITGITIAERFASKNRKVLIIDKRNHIGGNCYDFKDDDKILIHKYGPHIFHTKHKEVWDYLSKFTDWISYQHKVLGFIDGKFVPIPFNLNTLHELLPLRLAEELEKKLIHRFGYGEDISILKLRKIKDKNLKFLADFIYKKIFLYYSKKQWGILLEKIDFSVSERVPVVISRDDRYFYDKYQGVPKKGYTKMFKKMLQNKNIKIQLNINYKNFKNNFKYNILFYTGPIDEFFNYKFGKLDYRFLEIKFKTFIKKNYQPVAVVNYPGKQHKFTRITEFKKLTQQSNKKTVIGIEYPKNKGFIAWPILDNKNKRIFKKYQKEAEKLKKDNIYFIGRLAEYKYYNMDDAVKNSLDMVKDLIEI